jgi:hypothetical protein
MESRELLGLWGLLRKGISCIKFYRDLILPVSITLVLLAVFWLGEIDSFLLLGKICDMIIPTTSALLSFSLAGYALFVGMDVIPLLRPKEGVSKTTGEVTLYEKINIMFACYLVVQISLLVVSVIVSVAMLSPVSVSEGWHDIVNYFLILCSLIGFFYELVLLIHLVIIIYNYGLLKGRV